MTTYPVTLEPTERYRVEGVCEGFYVSETVITMDTRYGGSRTRMRVCYFTPDGKGRREHQGPILPGPFASMTPLPVVIDNAGGSGAERARLQAAGLEHDVTVGDRLLIDGVEYEISDPYPARDYPTLTPVEA